MVVAPHSQTQDSGPQGEGPPVGWRRLRALWRWALDGPRSFPLVPDETGEAASELLSGRRQGAGG